MKVQIAIFMTEVRACEKDLRYGVMIVLKKSIVGVHQFALSNRCRCLFGWNIRWTFLQGKLSNAHADRSRGNENDFMSAVF